MSASGPGKSVIGGLIALLALLAAGAALINVYAQKERQRDLDAWAVRLGLIAENRVNALEERLQARAAALHELAGNASLQLYLWRLGKREEPASGAEPAQLSYLRNLLLSSAERYGFVPDGVQPDIPANLPKHHDTGLSLLDTELQPVLSTAGMPELDPAFVEAARTALNSGKPGFSELVADARERVLLGIAVPVPMVLGARDNGRWSGVVLGVASAQRSLYPLLDAGVPVTSSDESLLVTKRNGQVIYLSPTRDGATPTRKTRSLEQERLAASAALHRPGSFGEYLNYRGEPVLATSRRMRSTPWLLVQQVDARQALAESDSHRRFMVTSFSLLLFFFAAVLVAAWRHGSSVRARHDADSLRAKTRELEKQTELLHAVTDNVEAYVVLMDADQHVLFVNTGLADKLGVSAAQLTGNSLAAVLGPANLRTLADTLHATRRDGATHHCARQMVIDGEERSFQCSLTPVDHVGERYHAMLLVLHDVTELHDAERRHARLMRNLVETLMHVVDLHDPNSANHSSRVVEVANAVGRELRLDPDDMRTLDLAANLANLGKIFVPREVLTKTAPLSEAEHALLQKHVQFATEMLADLDFEGPVVTTIAQKQEHLDGSGYPAGLKGEQILLTARILAVSNAFVALLSPRAYRHAIGVQDALDQLLKESGSKYDRQVVAALFHAVENRGDWSDHQSD
jgi:PAS domain S-box-containing protein